MGDLIELRETRLWHEWARLKDGTHSLDCDHFRCSGMVDVAYLKPPRALILDGKRGRKETTAELRNKQLRWLAALLCLNSKRLCAGEQIWEITVALLQHWSPANPPCVYKTDDLCLAIGEMESLVESIYEPEAKRTAGQVQCEYCRASSSCPEYKAWLSPVLPDISSLPMVPAKDWTPAQRVTFLEREKSAREWLAARKDEIKALMRDDPSAAPGYTLKDGRTIETIIDPQEVFNRFVLLGGKTEQFLPTVKVQKGDLKDAVRSVTGHSGTKLDEVVKMITDGCTESKQAAPTIERVK